MTDDGTRRGEDAAARILAARASRLAAPPAREAARTVPGLAFDAGEERYALALDAVLRVERVRSVARLPGPGRSALFSVDGRPCVLIDVPALLGHGVGDAAGRRWAIVLGRTAPELALAADTVDLAAIPVQALAGGPPPRLGATPDARRVVDAAALLDAAPGRSA